MPRRWTHRLGATAACALSAAAILLAVAPASGADRAAAQTQAPMSAGILAVQVRKQGFACTNPKDVTRDAARSTPAHAMWRLACENAKYRVHLVPKMSARVEKVE